MAAAVLLGLLLLVFFWRRPPASAPATAAAGVAQRSESAASAPKAAASNAAARLPQAAPAVREDSLRGTEVDGRIRVDAAGNLAADRELRRLFDYFLARLGERNPEQIRADLLAWLQQQTALSASVRAAVLHLFDRYVELQRASAALGRSGDLAADLERLRELRRRELGEELARAWFGEEEDYAALTAQRLALARDTGLDAATRSARLAELDAQLDPQQREVRAQSTDFQLALAQTAQLDAQQLSPAQRAQQRSELWGEAAAQRLGELDQQELDWNLRLRAYAQARERLLADSALAPSVREVKLQKLLQSFSETERRRVLALVDEGLLPR
ncbi:lipase secretion chaperone [Tahibacter harae]|uniref:Lipase chaperone n=1 Tax=Tahibacter harae TaxID=2963937 RepID=A0ABT1QSF3_9GAMM|nr:lipase secretion chaperone [Tahibacter harae]MCQ4165225.1 hypothetical protein [Tahibacter harae]